MNWLNEATLSSSWLHWVRQQTTEGGATSSVLHHISDGLDRLDEAIGRDRHSTGDPDSVYPNEWFVYAAAMMSRTAREAVEAALVPAVDEWYVNDPMAWQSLDMDEARAAWEASLHVISNVVAAWAQLWHDLAAYEGRLSGSSAQEVLDQWSALAEQASDTIDGVATASWAQCRV